MDDEAKRGEFENADFYDCDPEADRLGYRSVVDAVEESLCDIGGDGSITVYAWTRKTIPIGFCLKEAGTLLEQFIDCLVDNDLADPDGPRWEKSDEAIAIDRIAAALEELVATKPVWACEQTAQRVFTCEELRRKVAAAKEPATP